MNKEKKQRPARERQKRYPGVCIPAHWWCFLEEQASLDGVTGTQWIRNLVLGELRDRRDRDKALHGECPKSLSGLED